MYRTLIIVVCACLAVAACSAPLHAQQGNAKTSYCRPFDGRAKGLLSYAKRLASEESADMAENRELYSIPKTPASEVSYVTDEKLCRRAARKYHHAVGDHGKLDRQVYVVRIGNDRKQLRYIVLDPSEPGGEFQVYVVFDWRFKALAGFAG